MIKEDTFKKWLTEDMRYAGRSAKDVLSRCRRVERVLAINLNMHQAKGLKTPSGAALQFGTVRGPSCENKELQS